MMVQRPPVLDEAALSPAQTEVFNAIRQGPRGIVEGPLRIWLQSPDLAQRAQSLGAYCRYGTRLSPYLSELAILVVGAHWRSGFEWHVHAPIARASGLTEAAISAIYDGEAPSLTDEKAQAVYEFSQQLVRTRHVAHDTYSRAVLVLGLDAVVDLVGVLGYYTLISMTINAFHVAVPTGAKEPFGDWPD